MSQYVCVRVTRMDDVNIALFDYDRNNTLYFFIMNADEQIYMRYGGRDSESPDTYLNLASIELALKQGLELHAKYAKGELKKTELPKPAYPREIPMLVERTFARNNCVECHLIGDFQNLHREKDGVLDKLQHLYRSPDIKTIGIYLDVPQGLVVKEAKGAVAAAGMKPGDRIAALNGTPVWTFGDLQYRYDKVPRKSSQIRLTVERERKPVELTVNLPVRWWWTDLRFRQSSVDPRVYFDSRPLTEAEKKEKGLDVTGFASEVTHVDSFAQMMKSHALKTGDIVFGVDGAERDEFANTPDLYIKLHRTAGDSVTLKVMRDGKRMEMPLRTYRMSFRK
jgi:serine protease Do